MLNYSVIPSGAKRSREWSGPGKPRHRRGGRRLSEREVSESNLFRPEMSPAFVPRSRDYGSAGDFAPHDKTACELKVER